MLDMLVDMLGRIDDAAADVREWHTSPRFPIQKSDQQGIVDELRHIIERYASLTEAAGGDDAPLAMTGELRASMEGATDTDSQGRGDSLARSRPSPRTSRRTRPYD